MKTLYFIPFYFLLLLIVTIRCEPECPLLSCVQDDVDMKDACFKADPDSDGQIQTLKLRSCNRNSKMICFIPENQFVWVEADLQFIGLQNLNRPLTYADS